HMVTRKIDEILKMNVPVNMICPSHGVIWRDNPLQIVETYQKCAKEYQENQITIIYDTMWIATRRMAECIAQGLLEADPTLTVKLYNSAVDDKNDI
ncbi:anaerobic nitric oxide reductase flavorubredoxin, partial [Megasphaera massiliensis]|nr:anaerobic nitric oxide reductase flavorubredoxin [Megasphaera massiliensis]